MSATTSSVIMTTKLTMVPVRPNVMVSEDVLCGGGEWLSNLLEVVRVEVTRVGANIGSIIAGIVEVRCMMLVGATAAGVDV